MVQFFQIGLGGIVFLGGLAALLAGTACVADAIATFGEDGSENAFEAEQPERDSFTEASNDFARGAEFGEPTLAEGTTVEESDDGRRRFVAGDEVIHTAEPWAGF